MINCSVAFNVNAHTGGTDCVSDSKGSGNKNNNGKAKVAATLANVAYE